MDSATLKDTLANRILARSQEYYPLFQPGEFFTPTPYELDGSQVERIHKSHELMVLYLEEAYSRPMHVYETTCDYFLKYCELFSSYITEDDTQLWNCYFALLGIRGVKFGGKTPSDTFQALQQFMEIAAPPEGVLPPKLTATSPDVWSLLELLLVSLQLDSALDLLATVSQCLEKTDIEDSKLLSRVYQLLQTYPGRSPDTKEADFWQWRRHVLELDAVCNSSQSKFAPLVARVCKVLSGQVGELESASNHWTQAVVARYSYFNPDPQQWPSYVQSISEAARVAQDKSYATMWEYAVASAMNSSIVTAVMTIKDLDSSSGVMLSEFFSRCGLFPEFDKTVPSIREYVGLCYAIDLLGNPELVYTGITILENLQSPYSRNILAAALPNLGLEASTEARGRAIALATSLDMPETARALQLSAAKYQVKQNNYVDALVYYYEAGDLEAMRALTWDTFERFLIEGQCVGDSNSLEILRSDNVQSLGLPQPVLQCIAPVAVLTSILDSTFEEDDKAAARQARSGLTGFLSSPLIAKKYYPLLVATLSLVPVDNATTIQMMTALNSWDNSKETEQGYKLLTASRKANSPWTRDIDPLYTDSEVIKMVRRHLSENIWNK